VIWDELMDRRDRFPARSGSLCGRTHLASHSNCRASDGWQASFSGSAPPESSRFVRWILGWGDAAEVFRAGRFFAITSAGILASAAGQLRRRRPRPGGEHSKPVTAPSLFSRWLSAFFVATTAEATISALK